MTEQQEIAKALSYRERYQNYKKWFLEREIDRKKLKPRQYTSIKPLDYGRWLKQSSAVNVPANCRAGQGKEEWQS